MTKGMEGKWRKEGREEGKRTGEGRGVPMREKDIRENAKRKQECKTMRERVAHLDENPHVGEVLPAPPVERMQQL